MMTRGDMPIPGENYTSDTKNYPWHQPPEFTDIGEALDMMSGKLTAKKSAMGVMSLAEVGFPLVRIAQMIIMEGVSQGKFTVDMALLLAGPVTKIIEIICDQDGIEYNLGLDEEDEGPTGTFYKEQIKMKQEASKPTKFTTIINDEIDNIKAEAETQDGETEQEAPEGDIQQEGFAQMMSSSKDKSKE